jgi:DNA-binding transcriptional ArsR family regulator
VLRLIRQVRQGSVVLIAIAKYVPADRRFATLRRGECSQEAEAFELAAGGVETSRVSCLQKLEPFILRFVRVIVVEACDLLCLDLDAAETVRGSLDVDGASRLAGTLKAFSDPTRLLIVQALAERELCGCDLGWVTGQSDKVVSHHLGRLRREGLVASRREGKVVFASLTVRGRVLLERVEAIAAV